MRRLLCALIVLVGATCVVSAKPAPLSVKEVSLMLRSGYSVPAVESELAKRHFIEPVDAAAEKSLLLAGATPALIASLRSGAYAIPQAELAAAQAEIEAQAKRKALQAEQARQSNTLYQAKLAQERALAAATAPPVIDHKIAALVKGDLVTSKNGVLSVVNDDGLAKKKLIGLYFSGRWCPACRKFTPELVQYHNRIAAAHPEFEMLFISSDRSAAAMEAYMRDEQMPWPAVKFDKIEEKAALKAYAGKGVPCLVIVDATGKVVSDSYAGENYRGPRKVLQDLDQIFGAAASAPVALQR